MGDALIQTPRPFSAIQTVNVNFEVAMFGHAVDQSRENSGIYHNPKRQRGIPGNSGENAKSQSVVDAF